MKFSEAEDNQLKRLVRQSGCDVNWKLIAEAMGNGRSSRQCRERYRNYLSPKLKNGPWTPEEEILLEEKYQIFGPKWSKMAKFFKGRSDVNLKNHWVSMLNRKSKAAFETKKRIEIFMEVPDDLSPSFPEENTEKEVDPLIQNPIIPQTTKQSSVQSTGINQGLVRRNSTVAVFRDDRARQENEIAPDEFEFDCFAFNLDWENNTDPFVFTNDDFELSMLGL